MLENLQRPKDKTSNCGISDTLYQAQEKNGGHFSSLQGLAPLELLCVGNCFLHLSIMEAQN